MLKTSNAYEPRRKCRKATFAGGLIWIGGYISAVEDGKKNVTLAILEKLANARDVSVDDLLK